MSQIPSLTGEPDIASIASAFADPRHARVLMALTDGRALPAGRLAEEAGVSASTISNHLAVLLNHELVAVERQGRHRYYRLATSEVEGVLEALARLAPRTPIASLRAHTRAHAVRTARTCYRHLAGQAGVKLFQQFIGAGWITGGDAIHRPDVAGARLSSPGKGNQYQLTPEGAGALETWGVPPKLLSTVRPLHYSRPCGRCATASTGPNKHTTSPAHSAPRSQNGSSTSTGSPRTRSHAASTSPPKGEAGLAALVTRP